MRAVELDDKLADAHLALAFIKWGDDWDWTAAERELKRTIELAPTYSPALNTYAHYLMSMGRTEEALAESRLALELDPNNVDMSSDLAWCYLIAG